MLQNEPLPELRNPLLIAAFEGWNDAGEAASETVRHLAAVWDATPVASIDPDDYYDFQVNRPRIVIEAGRRVLRWPTTHILVASPAALDRDVLLVVGVEPSTRWRAFVDQVVDLAVEAGVTEVMTLGGLLADVAHTRPIPVTVTSDHGPTRRRYMLEESSYEGPTGIVGVLATCAEEEGIGTLAAWAAVPHYAGGAPAPKATLALLEIVENHLDTVIPRGTLERDSLAWEQSVDELAAMDEDVAEYVTTLEDAQDTAELPEASGESLAREFERYLRGQGGDDEGRGRPTGPHG